jgi:hypothetical protein
MTVVMLTFLMYCGVCHGAAERWSNFAEDSDLKYFIDQKSMVSLPDNVYIFWVKSVAKDKDYFKKEYNLSNVSYMFTSYEMDCAVSSYRIRGTIMFDKNRKEVSKSLPEVEAAFEPIPPESMLELAQEEVCAKGENATEGAEGGDLSSSASVAPAPAEVLVAPVTPATVEETPELQ